MLKKYFTKESDNGITSNRRQKEYFDKRQDPCQQGKVENFKEFLKPNDMNDLVKEPEHLN